MSSIDAVLQTLSKRVQDHSETIATEEAAKTSIVLPLLQSLGYDIFDPSEVIPEFSSDVTGKKGEKVDYAIQLDGEVAILIECKGLSTSLDKRHLSQLYRYFSVTNAKFAILTNGQFFEFYSDLEEPNKLDKRPFFILDLLDVNAAAVAELSKFEKSSFDVGKILATAERLKYVSAIKRFLSKELQEPGEDMIKLVASEVHDGRVTAAVRSVVGAAMGSAYKDIVREAVRARLSSALDQSADVETDESETDMEGGIVTTQDEIEGMLTIRAIVRNVLSADRVGLRDAKSYCAVLVDDNNRKPLARMHFNRNQWYLGLFDGGSEERIPISSLSEIYDHAERLRATAKKYVHDA